MIPLFTSVDGYHYLLDQYRVPYSLSRDPLPEGETNATLEVIAEAFDVPIDFLRSCCVEARRREREYESYRDWLWSAYAGDVFDFSVSTDAHRVAALADEELKAWADFIAEVKL